MNWNVLSELGDAEKVRVSDANDGGKLLNGVKYIRHSKLLKVKLFLEVNKYY